MNVDRWKFGPQDGEGGSASPEEEARRNRARAEKEWREKIEIGVKTKRSDEHPEYNGDVAFINRDIGAFGVLDGFGKDRASEIAATIAKDAIEEILRTHDSPTDSQETNEAVRLAKTEEVIRLALRGADRAIRDRSRKPETHRMYVAVAIVKLWKTESGEIKGILGDIGNCRVQALRKNSNGALDVLSENYLIRHFDDEGNESSNSSHEFKHALGMGKPEEISLDIIELSFQDGDQLLITSNGVHENLSPEQIIEIMERASSGQDCADALIQLSHEHRKFDDDMTVVVVKL